MNPNWTPWTVDLEHPPAGGLIERDMPDGSKEMHAFYITAPTLHRVLKDFIGSSIPPHTGFYKKGEIVYMLEGLSRMAIKKGWAEEIHEAGDETRQF